MTKRAAISGAVVLGAAITIAIAAWTGGGLGSWVLNQVSTYKVGTSDVPHYWYREFDLDLGRPLGKIRFDESIWSREFENAVVLVNPGKAAGQYSVDGSVRCYDIRGLAVPSPVVLKSRTAMLLIKNLFILPGQRPESKP